MVSSSLYTGTSPDTKRVPTSTRSPILTIGTPLRTTMDTIVPSFSAYRSAKPSSLALCDAPSASFMDMASSVPENLAEIHVISGKVLRASFSKDSMSTFFFWQPTKMPSSCKNVVKRSSVRELLPVMEISHTNRVDTNQKKQARQSPNRKAFRFRSPGIKKGSPNRFFMTTLVFVFFAIFRRDLKPLKLMHM